MLKDAVTLRALQSDDMAFIERLYAETRAEEMSRSGWPAEQVATFLSQQFHTQHAYYQAHYSGAEFLVIAHEGKAIGRLYRFWGPAKVNLIDIALVAEYQKQGIGSALVDEMVRRADAEGLLVELFVETYNPAQRLYSRLGFAVINQSGVYLRMRREPRPASRKAP
ncbi:TPA: GNAT family N-acetyltransferase [Pseudomonas putida]|jgi:ribosomal protein S18 acetylase RimI-like enzyme|uniref:GNAT family N-acetyltransferase n=1 Tax=Pseudomonas sp. NBRC 111123 TaxID=1661038 RepID=UPI0004886E8E|nr:ribosomal protein S18 acetylase RimI-like enzyme [Pseudomonas sp. URMO17WK12:I7]SMF69801.1 Ribosomal protein S18 acetylase RimI [Pseudomonas sp. URMO17WK12:I5]HDS1679054.1 GNAT family N-acetyltransferase [Pseudomonas putida]